MTAVNIVGGGLAGCEAALQLDRLGIPCRLHEMRPEQRTPAHRSDGLAEIVCSNSLKSIDTGTASGLFKAELDHLGCRLLELARGCAVPAGAALAVDTRRFSEAVENAIVKSSRIEIVRGRVDRPSDGEDPWIIASGPLTAPELQDWISRRTGDAGLHFYDAIAPTVTLASLDTSILYRAARYDRGEADYLNSAMDRETYQGFWKALVEAEKADVKAFDRGDLFDGCMPIEEIAASGPQTLSFGPLRPVGLIDPRSGQRPYAVVQLRQENAEGTLFGLVGFQTRLKQGEQRRVLRMIPGLEAAEFVRYGQLHRNFYLDTPRQLDRGFALPAEPRIHFAGQLTGVEGYVESIASGLFTAWTVAAGLRGMTLPEPPETTLCGALLYGHLFDRTASRFTPMNVNFGILPAISGLPAGRRGRKDRKIAQSERALLEIGQYRRSETLKGLLEPS